MLQHGSAFEGRKVVGKEEHKLGSFDLAMSKDRFVPE